MKFFAPDFKICHKEEKSYQTEKLLHQGQRYVFLKKIFCQRPCWNGKCKKAFDMIKSIPNIM